MKPKTYVFDANGVCQNPDVAITVRPGGSAWILVEVFAHDGKWGAVVTWNAPRMASNSDYCKRAYCLHETPQDAVRRAVKSHEPALSQHPHFAAFKSQLASYYQPSERLF